MITIISFFFLVLVSGYGFSNIQFPLVEDSLIGKDKICSLTNVEPYYSCSKKWTIFLYDEEFPQVCNENIAPGLASHSCTKLVTYDNQVLSADIHLGTEHGAQTEFPFPDGPEFQTILYHELQHAICGCTWHAELVDFI